MSGDDTPVAAEFRHLWPRHDDTPISAEFRRLFPPGTPGIDAAAPGGQERPSRTLVHPAPPAPGGRRPSPRPVAKPKRRKKKAKTPGGDGPGARQQDKRTPVYDPPSSSGRRPAPRTAK
jgi:hypothetical protein